MSLYFSVIVARSLARRKKVSKEWCGKLMEENVKENKIFSFLFLLILNRKFLKITFFIAFFNCLHFFTFEVKSTPNFPRHPLVLFSAMNFFTLFLFCLWPSATANFNNRWYFNIQKKIFTQIIYTFLLFLSENDWMNLQKWEFFSDALLSTTHFLLQPTNVLNL